MRGQLNGGGVTTEHINYNTPKWQWDGRKWHRMDPVPSWGVEHVYLSVLRLQWKKKTPRRRYVIRQGRLDTRPSRTVHFAGMFTSSAPCEAPTQGRNSALAGAGPLLNIAFSSSWDGVWVLKNSLSSQSLAGISTDQQSDALLPSRWVVTC